MKAIDTVKIARDKDRPHGIDFINKICDNFFEMCGDRSFSDDKAIIGGVCNIGAHIVTVLAIEKGRTTEDRQLRNFGMPHPEGYRKSLRLMRQANKFNRPIICFVDTAGAFPGLGAEERGQGTAIAENLMEMFSFNVPIITILTGEGGSGGALALSVANEVYMLKNSVYSVISPEGCASILFKDSTKSEEAAEALKLKAENMLELGVIEGIIEEDDGLMDRIKCLIIDRLNVLKDQENLKEKRFDRFRKF
ncbi:MAG: acetyl-CoA carboxylase carboxyl transferase subunit alpha [Firmicutes bacterium]|nr:acetyl-CoA carboxylase carboxyl transferase subunit alpha [Bacillota bacterium]